jgi:hypothetical protein
MLNKRSVIGSGENSVATLPKNLGESTRRRVGQDEMSDGIVVYCSIVV